MNEDSEWKVTLNLKEPDETEFTPPSLQELTEQMRELESDLGINTNQSCSMPIEGFSPELPKLTPEDEKDIYEEIWKDLFGNSMEPRLYEDEGNRL